MSDASTDPDLSMIIESMRNDYIVNAQDQLGDIDDALDGIDDGTGRYENHVLELKRIVHSIKGSAGSFGFMSITRVAHAFEDYIETSGSHGRIPVLESRKYAQVISDILAKGEDKPEEETAMILDALPVPVQPGVSAAKKFKGKALLLMPPGVQRKIISRELGTFGLRTTVYDNALEAMDFALSGATDLLITSMYLKRMTGLEFAGAMAQFDRTKHLKCAVLAANEEDTAGARVPANAVVITKGPSFARDLLSFLESAGFGR